MSVRDRSTGRGAAIAEGVIAGLAAAVMVSLVHLVYDITWGSPLRTPALLDAVVFDGRQTVWAVEPDLASVIRFSLVHVGAWICAGAVAALAVGFVERRPSAWFGTFGGIALVFVSLFYLGGVFSIPGEGALHLWLGTFLGAATLATVLSLRHPELAGRIEAERISEGERHAVEAALAAERRCLTLHDLLFAGSALEGPMSAVAGARERRIDALGKICRHYALPLGEEEPLQPGPGDPEDACRTALEAERDLIDLYDRLLVSVVEPRIRKAFLRHRWESHDEHLQIFDDCLARRTA